MERSIYDLFFGGGLRLGKKGSALTGYYLLRSVAKHNLKFIHGTR